MHVILGQEPHSSSLYYSNFSLPAAVVSKRLDSDGSERTVSKLDHIPQEEDIEKGPEACRNVSPTVNHSIWPGAACEGRNGRRKVGPQEPKS